ncbi:TPA: hypothetical protein EYP66_16980 [Candidatus Poribacteria bacterium]|nr:hypothetical protein [Candidatus Poribacteria bacterium]
MRQINEKLTGIEDSNLVTDEQEGEIVDEQSENILAEQNSKSGRRHKNIDKDKNEDVALEPQPDFQTAPSESQNLPSNEVNSWMENLEFILDIPLQIDIQLGQTKIPLKEVLELSPGSLIKLNKSESAPVELLINGKLIAEGQIVVTEENTLGVQVTSIVNRVERIRSLR